MNGCFVRIVSSATYNNHMTYKGTVPVIGLYEEKVGKLSEALNKNFYI